MGGAGSKGAAADDSQRGGISSKVNGGSGGDNKLGSIPEPPPHQPSSWSSTYSDDDDDCNCDCRNPFGRLFGGRGGKFRSMGSGHYDPIGTPMPETPPHVRRRRMKEAGTMSSRYGGLEKETSEVMASASAAVVPAAATNKGAGGRQQRQRRGHAGGQQRKDNSHGGDGDGVSRRHSADVHEGPLGEQVMAQKYELCEVLGVGSTSTCHRCVEIATGTSYACKIIDRKHIEQRFRGMVDQFRTEIRALRSLNHPNIIYLRDVYITDEKIFIVMEIMRGGELFDYVVQKGTLTEEEASKIIRQVTSALVYMHTKNIIHRDLKPENLLLKHEPRTPQDVPEVKIIDFGLSKCMEEPMARSFLGTRGYLAPEMLQRRQYTRQVDAWALGVITYVLLCGCLPFDDDSVSVPSDDVLRAKFVLRFPRWAKNLSPSAKDLLNHLLDINPRTRYTAEQALEHPWVTGASAPKNSFLQSPSLMMRKREGGGGVGSAGGSSRESTPMAARRRQNNNRMDRPTPPTTPKPPGHVRQASF